jgi:hypothetical protein
MNQKNVGKDVTGVDPSHESMVHQINELDIEEASVSIDTEYCKGFGVIASLMGSIGFREWHKGSTKVSKSTRRTIFQLILCRMIEPVKSSFVPSSAPT